MMLEYNGKKGSDTSANRRAACSKLQCSKIYGKGWQCDEFPFASTVEGGDLAAVMYVLGKHNGVIEGKWGNMVKGKDKGTKIRVKIKNYNCSKVFDKRDVVRRAGAVLRNDTDALYLDSSVFGNYSQGPVAMLLPLDIPDAFVGSFKVDFTISQGNFIAGSVIDDEGNEYGS